MCLCHAEFISASYSTNHPKKSDPTPHKKTNAVITRNKILKRVPDDMFGEVQDDMFGKVLNKIKG